MIAFTRSEFLRKNVIFDQILRRHENRPSTCKIELRSDP